QADRDFLVLDGDYPERLRNRKWNFSAREKVGFLSANRHQRRFRQHFNGVFLLQGIDKAGPGNGPGLEPHQRVDRARHKRSKWVTTCIRTSQLGDIVESRHSEIAP